MFHLAAYYQSLDPAGALTKLNAVSDQAIRTNGQDIVIPSDLTQLVAEYGASAATSPQYGQVESPSLRQLTNQDIAEIQSSVAPTGFIHMQSHFRNPRPLKANESVNLAINATGGAAAANYGLIWLANAALPIVSGNIFTVRATAAAALVAGSWVNSDLTFDTTLPAGTYNVVGMRAEGTNLLAARLVFVGEGYRPGVLGLNAPAGKDDNIFRYGNVGSFGVFDVNQPPTVDCLGVTDTSQTIYLDMIKVS